MRGAGQGSENGLRSGLGRRLGSAARTLARALRRGLRDERGGVAPIFAWMSLTLLIPLTGGVIDLSRVTAARTSLQDASDVATLALARDPNVTTMTDAQLVTKASNWVSSNVNMTDFSATPSVGAPDRSTAGQIKLHVSAQVQPTLSAIIHLGPFPVAADSVVTIGLNHVELALVLDNTGSMADDNKLANLKTAASTLVSTLAQSSSNGADPDVLKIGVVPFSVSVNIGASYQGQSWLTGVQPAAYGPDLFTSPLTDRFALLKAMNNTAWGGCIESRPMPYDVQDDAPQVGAPATLFVPYFAPDEPDDGGYSGSTYYGYANSYLKDVPADTTFANKQGDVAKYVGKPATAAVKYNSVQYGPNALSPYAVGPNSGCGTAAMLPLTTDINAVNAELTRMVASGNTHIPLGMAWGWNVLSPNMPFGAQPYNTPHLVKIAVLVTDGANTYAQSGAPGTGGYANVKICKSGNGLAYCPGTTGTPADDNSNYTGYGYSWQKRISTDSGSYGDPVTAMNNRLAKVCANMKAAGVTIYTVPVEVTDTGIKTLLQGCASQPGYYIDVTDSSKLQAAFTNIAGSISALRISH